MAELNARDEGLRLDQRVTITSVVYSQLVDTQGIRYYQVRTVSRSAALLFQEYSVVGVQADKLELHIVSLEWHEGAIRALLLEIYLKDHIILDSIVLWVHSLPSISTLNR